MRKTNKTKRRIETCLRALVSSWSRRRCLDAEGEQHVSRPPAERAIAGVYVEHAAGDDRAGAADRRALGRDAVHRFEVAVGVIFPQQRSVFRRIAANTAIVGPGDDDA